MNHEKQYDTPITLPKNSFVAYFFYCSKEKALHVIYRKSGKQYKYTVTNKLVNELLDCNNRGSFINQRIIRNRKIDNQYIGIVPQSTIQEITMPKSYKNWLGR